MTTSKRAYKLQEFVAHASNVNCLKIGRKTSRVLVTGGEDHKVNIWSIGKPSAILNLSGHTSAVETVSFDSSEVLVAAGAANGTIKLWDLEEAKIVRTLTGHRSNCISVDFHPFGEFFASGSLDTNLKIWDIRRKGCIHTYKGHARGVNAIRFTPDGRWVVSGGEDNVVKLWDLTAGKILHDFKFHEGQIQCMDFHPHEFLLATGSADRTVKFWDLETFELIGSAGPENSGVRSMTFNPDGRTLLCGLHESLKVLSWEPIRCHDSVDVGWSRLADLNVHEGKLLGCSYNQSCVGVWVVDISRVEPYAIPSSDGSNGHPESKSTLHAQIGSNIKPSMGRLSISQNLDLEAKETKSTTTSGSLPGTPQRAGSHTNPKIITASSTIASTLKRGSTKSQATHNVQIFNKPDVIPVVVPRTSPRVEQPADLKREMNPGREMAFGIHSKLIENRKQTSKLDDSENENLSFQSRPTGFNFTESNEIEDQNFSSVTNGVKQQTISTQKNLLDVNMGHIRTGKPRSNMLMEPASRYQLENYDMEVQKPTETYPVVIPKGRTHLFSSNWDKRERSSVHDGLRRRDSSEATPTSNFSFSLRGHTSSAEKDTVVSDQNLIAALLEQHGQFSSSLQSHITKLQVVHRLWERGDVKGVISAMEKMSDRAVSADVISVLLDKSDMVTLEICTCLLPLLTILLDGKIDRHISISLDMLLKLVKVFGPVIRSTLSATTAVGVDLQAEERLDRCNMCFIELEKVRNNLPSLRRRGGSISKSAQELNLALQEAL